MGASFVREVEPGELVAIDEEGLRSRRFAPAEPRGCVFEYVYLARPDTTIAGRGVHDARVEMGRALAREHPVQADLVMPTPESGTPAAIGFAQESGIPFGHGLVKNSYVGRTFIAPSQTIRQLGIRLKLNPLRDVIKGKRLVVVDDSIVRGNTQRALVRMLREAGAHEVHVRISSLAVRWPCFYGIDFATRAELIANGLAVEEVGRSIGADSLGFISEEGMIAATGQAPDRLCRACFTGEYPVPLPVDGRVGKGVLELQLPVVRPSDMLDIGLGVEPPADQRHPQHGAPADADLVLAEIVGGLGQALPVAGAVDLNDQVDLVEADVEIDHALGSPAQHLATGLRQPPPTQGRHHIELTQRVRPISDIADEPRDQRPPIASGVERHGLE